MEIKNIIIVLTPFQKHTIQQLFKSLFSEKSTLVFHSEHTSLNSCDCEVLRINNFKFSRKKLFNYDYYKKTRKAIADIRDEINSLESRYTFDNALDIYIGSEKDIFTQMFLQSGFIKSRIKNLTAVEEGLGYYKYRSDLKTTLTKYVYKYFTPLLFKEKLEFIYTLGVDARINKVYARLPQMLPIIRKSTEYFQISNTKAEAHKTYNGKADKILIFSFPNQDYGLNEEEKAKIYSRLLASFSKKTIVIKPHPRENDDFFDRFMNKENVQVVRKDQAGESMDYFEFEKIINFSSSVIIDILMADYPKKAVYTIFMKKTSDLSFFNDTNCIKLFELDSYNFEN